MISFKPLLGYLAYNRITLRELSEKTGISYPALMNLKKYNTFSVRNLDKICQALNLNIKDIMRFE